MSGGGVTQGRDEDHLVDSVHAVSRRDSDEWSSRRAAKKGESGVDRVST